MNHVMGETERQRFRADTRLNTAMEMSKLREYVRREEQEDCDGEIECMRGRSMHVMGG